jgi:N-acetylmuramoyl-L-alanine amidase
MEVKLMNIRNPLRPLSIFCGSVLLAGAVLFCGNPAWSAGGTAVVTANAVNVRSGPGTDYAVVAQAKQGEKMNILEQDSDWYSVALNSGGQGWVAGWLLDVQQSQPAAATTGQVAVLNGNYINIRSGPGTNHGVVAQGNSGERYQVLDKSGDWVRIQLTTGTGWVSGWLVKLEGGQAPTPQAPAGQPPATTPVSGSKVATVSGSVVNIRSGPGTTNPVVGSVVQGNNLTVLGQEGDWYQVSLPTGGTGWIAGWLVTVKDTPGQTGGSTQPAQPPAGSQTPPAAGSTEKIAVVNGSVVNVRSGPGTSSSIIGTVVKGNSLPLLGQSGDWCQVKLPNGSSGWVAGWLVALNDTVSRGADRNEHSAVGNVQSMVVKKTSTEQTSFVIKTDTPVTYNSFFLSNPDRLVVDIQGVAPGTLAEKQKVGTKTVSTVRSGYFQKNPAVTRLVFELNKDAMYEVSLAGDRKTLTVDTYIPNLAEILKNRRIVIDPGHGGPDPGAIGQAGTREKAINLDIARRVEKLLKAKMANAIMTRSRDSDVGLYAHSDIANKGNADIFVSIHINANDNPSIGGTSTYIYPGSGSSSETLRRQESYRLAQAIQDELVDSLGLRDIGVKEANFAVLRTSNMPAVLVELAFISNEAEEKLINTDSFKNKAAQAIVDGIVKYFAGKRTA